jgi:hypothetical protein
VLTLALKIAIRVSAAVAIALITFPVTVLAFHPWEGPIVGYSLATQPERYFALALSVAVLAAVLWRLLCGSTLRQEFKRVLDSYASRDTQA